MKQKQVTKKRSTKKTVVPFEASDAQLWNLKVSFEKDGWVAWMGDVRTITIKYHHWRIDIPKDIFKGMVKYFTTPQEIF